MINEICVNIDEIISFDDNKKVDKKKECPKIEFIFCDDLDDKTKIINEEEKKKGMLSYYFEKLSQKKQLFCIDVMVKEYINDEEILEELSFIKKVSLDCDIEYDISFIYLKFILNNYWEENRN